MQGEGKDTQTDHVHVYRGGWGDTKPGQDAEAGRTGTTGDLAQRRAGHDGLLVVLAVMHTRVLIVAALVVAAAAAAAAATTPVPPADNAFSPLAFLLPAPPLAALSISCCRLLHSICSFLDSIASEMLSHVRARAWTSGRVDIPPWQHSASANTRC